MGKAEQFIYFAEGECEVKFLQTLMNNLHLIRQGKIIKLNVTQKRIPTAKLLTIDSNTSVVFVFDTDTDYTSTLNENIKAITKLNKTGVLLVLLPQVLNFEDELVRCTDIKSITELTGSGSKSDFKRDFLKTSNLDALLRKHKFTLAKMWKTSPRNFPSGRCQELIYLSKRR